jgi:hypothetical protein
MPPSVTIKSSDVMRRQVVDEFTPLVFDIEHAKGIAEPPNAPLKVWTGKKQQR